MTHIEFYFVNVCQLFAKPKHLDRLAAHVLCRALAMTAKFFNFSLLSFAFSF